MSKIIPAINAKELKEANEILDKKEELLDVTTEKEEKKTVDEAEKKWDMYEKILYLFEKNVEKDETLKEKYAIILITILVVELLVLLVIFILQGCCILNYSDSTLNIFITGGIAEIFVLVKVIVQYLFKDNLTDALKIILENNNKIKSEKPNVADKNYDNE